MLTTWDGAPTWRQPLSREVLRPVVTMATMRAMSLMVALACPPLTRCVLRGATILPQGKCLLLNPPLRVLRHRLRHPPLALPCLVGVRNLLEGIGEMIDGHARRALNGMFLSTALTHLVKRLRARVVTALVDWEMATGVTATGSMAVRDLAPRHPRRRIRSVMVVSHGDRSRYWHPVLSGQTAPSD